MSGLVYMFVAYTRTRSPKDYPIEVSLNSSLLFRESTVLVKDALHCF